MIRARSFLGNETTDGSLRGGGGGSVEVQEGSLKACHARTLGKLGDLHCNTELLADLLYKLDGQRPPSNEIGALAGKNINADKEPDHPTFTARKIENLLDQEIAMQHALMDQINRLIG